MKASDVDLGPPISAEDLVNGVLVTFREGASMPKERSAG